MANNPRLRGQEVAEELEGTCRSLHEVASEEETEDPDFLEALDELVFNCTCCGRWFEVGEMTEDCDGELICTDCGSEEP